MTRYTLVNLDEGFSHYACMVVVNSYPLENMEQITLIECDLKEKMIIGTVLFDMLACAGDNSERYLTLEFDGKNFELDSCQFVQFSKGNYIRQISMKVYQQLNDELYNTVLNSKQINLLLHGVAI